MIQWVDAHLHIKDEPGLSLKLLLDAMRSLHRESGFAACNVLSIPSWEQDHTLQNLLGILYKANYPEDTYFFGGMDYYPYKDYRKDCHFAAQLERLLEMGADGIKLIESKPMVRKLIGGLPFTDPAYDGFWDLSRKSHTQVHGKIC